jgi:predicted RNase H-like nuclease (RuvC/YqgF family)
MSNNSNERIEELDSENLELRKYINNLERECDETRMPITKNIHDISNRQKKRRIQTLRTRAQKALWFSKQFGLDLAALQFEDNKGQTYNWKVPETKPNVSRNSI